jgi:hypothetical protein
MDKRQHAEELLSKLTPTQRRFVHARLSLSRAEDVAAECNSKTSHPNQWADAMMRKPAVREASR